MDVYNNVKYSKFLLLVFAHVQVSQEISACQKLYLTSKGVRQSSCIESELQLS